MKMSLIKDTLSIVAPPGLNLNDPAYKGAASLGPCKPCGGYVVLCDEEAEALEAREKEEALANRCATASHVSLPM